jgi:hypothetical protein
VVLQARRRGGRAAAHSRCVAKKTLGYANKPDSIENDEKNAKMINQSLTEVPWFVSPN